MITKFITSFIKVEKKRNKIIKRNLYIFTFLQGQNDELGQLRHDVQLMLNRNTCKEHYLNLTGLEITDNMFCGSWFYTPVQRICTEDSGGPVLHFNENHSRFVIIGVTAFNNECGQIRFPGVSTRVSRYISWIQENAR